MSALRGAYGMKYNAGYLFGGGKRIEGGGREKGGNAGKSRLVPAWGGIGWARLMYRWLWSRSSVLGVYYMGGLMFMECGYRYIYRG